MTLCNAAFEGGGVRGIGHVGAACVFEKKGYDFLNLVGSSAGAIVATLLAVGYKCDEIKEIMKSIDYLKFKQKDLLDCFGTVGKFFSIVFDFGIYNADYFENWLNKLLKEKGKATFGDVRLYDRRCKRYKYKLQVTASDLTDKKLLVLPRDLWKFGINPDSYSIAKAVRMSMSIPIFYEPFHLKDKMGREHLIVDGGLLSNYPIWILDDGESYPQYPTFGFKFIENSNENSIISRSKSNINIFDYLKLLVSTTLDANDKQYISNSKGDFQRTIGISTKVKVDGKIKNISATDFDITKKESIALFNNGVNAAERFLEHWDFNKWRNTFRR
ncbi:patatin-like phospholipase family protein [Anaerovorax odorimutans]|uniref:patatin-like phospholipase family protein n=1 Tax=Anaerovorax odorimutans TaxID=109327 RepID=UPI0003FBB655|nr:patatin-like phospholipase family protein [Anaerovorax odorimutans]